MIVALIFGTKRIKEVGGDLGSAVKSFRKAMNTASEVADESRRAAEAADARRKREDQVDFRPFSTALTRSLPDLGSSTMQWLTGTPNFNFVKYRRVAMVTSSLLSLLAIVSVILSRAQLRPRLHGRHPRRGRLPAAARARRDSLRS